MQVLAETGDVVAAALALDAADAACTAGATTAASSARAKARPAFAKGKIAVTLLPSRLRAYAKALDELAAAERAASRLSKDQRAALDAVVVGGRAENAAADAFRVAGKTAEPSYAALNDVQSLWLDRRLAGWYRTTEEAAAAYASLSVDQRPALERARTLLRRVDAARRPVSERERAALAAADAALSSLRAPG